MWLGEQIDEYGIGNGISLIIMAGIVSRMPWAVRTVWRNTDFSVVASPDKYGLPKIVFLIAAFVFVIAGAILITQGQRRIPIQQAKQMRGRRMYGGQRHYLPLRVNHGGVMPIIFASSFMMFPPIIISQILSRFQCFIYIVNLSFCIFLGNGAISTQRNGKEFTRCRKFHSRITTGTKNC